MTLRETILDFYKAVFNAKKVAGLHLTENFEEFYSGELENSGREAFYERYRNFFERKQGYVEIIHIIEEREEGKVAAYIKMKDPEGTTFSRAADIFKLENGKIAWHTATIQPCIQSSRIEI